MGDVCKILLVDDVEMNLVILSEIITQMGHEPLSALSAKAALEILKNDLPNLILLDVSMPDISGLEFCEMLKKDVYTREIPVIFISAMDSQDDLSKAFELGAVDYIFKPFDPNNVKVRVSTHLKVYEMQRELEEANKRLNTVIKHQIDIGKMRQKVLYKGLEKVISQRDKKRTFTYGMESHMVRILAQAMQFSDKYEDAVSESFIQDMEIASAFHDIGLLTVPESILLKSEELTSEEYDIIKKHVESWEQHLDMSRLAEIDSSDGFGKILYDIVRYHHENFDGTGYPNGLSGEDIPLSARIMAVIDGFDALINDRCYRKAYSVEEAISIMEEDAGKKYDPDIVSVLKKIQRQFKKIGA